MRNASLIALAARQPGQGWRGSLVWDLSFSSVMLNYSCCEAHAYCFGLSSQILRRLNVVLMLGLRCLNVMAMQRLAA